VIEVASAEDALQMVRDGLKIDLLVTVFAMPGMNGAQLAGTLRKNDPTLPVLMITGFASVTEADMGGFPRLAKPFRQTELIVQVGEALSSKQRVGEA
jgi:DNA-binding NtrC family response regulator